jgi:hypothetical protein
MRRLLFFLLPALVLTAPSGAAWAAACTSVATGNWSAQTTWGAAGTGCAGAPGGIPGANDTVTIANLAHTVTITDTRQIGNLTLAAGNQSATLQLQNGARLSVIAPGPGNHDVVVGAPSANGVTKLVQLLGSSTLIVGRDLNISGGTAATRNAEVRVEGGSTLTVGRDVLLNNNARSLLTFLAAGTLNLARDMQDTGTFSCPACTVNFTGGGAQNIAGTPSGYTYFNLVDQKTGNTASFLEDTTIAGSITDNGNLDLVGNGPIITLSGNAAQTISGSAATTSFDSLLIAKTVGTTVTLSHSIDLATDLTLATGIISTGTNTVVLPAGVTLGGGSTSSYVSGCLQVGFNAWSWLNFRAAGLDEFPVGIAGSYLPIEFTAGFTITAGTLRVCANSGDHPLMTPAAGGGIDTAKSLNRYWSMTNTGLNTSFLLVNAIFKFPNGASEYDPGATPANFIVQRHDGVDWNPTTRVAALGTSTQAQNINLTAGTDDFAIGEPLATFPPALGAFNAFDTTTPAGAVLGNIQTKQAGVAFSVRVVRIANNAVDANYNQAGVTVQLYNASNNTGGFTNGCRSTWSAIGGGTPPSVAVNFAAGVATASFSAAMLPNVWRDVRVHVIQAGGAGEGCSTDRFAIRPTGFAIAVTDGTWSTAGTTRALTNTTLYSCATPGVAHKAGQPFTITATASPAGATQYDGSITVGAAAGSLQCRTDYGLPAGGCATGALSLGAWTNGVSRVSSTVSYNEAGSFNLLLEDIDFASVDANDGTSLANRTVPQTGGAIAVGRFVPDHFKFTAPNTPQLQTFGSACAAARSFTYIGQRFWFVTRPSATLQAVAADDTTVTTNYRGNLFKLTSGGLAESYTGNGPGLATGSAVNPPQLASPGNGTATYSANMGAANVYLTFTRSTSSPIPAVNNPFAANVSLSVSAAEAANCETGGTISTSSALVFNGGGGGIAFDGAAFTPVTPNIAGGTAFVYGRMRLLNAFGSGLNLPVPIRTEFWTGTGFVLNSVDSCSTMTAKNFVLSNWQGGLTAANMVTPTGASNGNISTTGTFVNGVGGLTLLKPSPTPGTPGSVDVCMDLDVAAGGNDATCQAVTPADDTYLQLLRTSPPNTYTQDPVGRAAFGLYGSQPSNFIFFRENY